MSFQFSLRRTPSFESTFLHCFCEINIFQLLALREYTCFHFFLPNEKQEEYDKNKTYMRILRGSSKAKNSEQNLCTEAKELRSISNRITSAWGLSFWIFSLTSLAFLKSLAPITTLTPLFANTLAVSAPIPEVAPSIKNSTTNYNFIS